jgi:hypothetical protein
VAPVEAATALRLRAELTKELANLADVATALGARRALANEDAIYAAALLLMSWYTGAERALSRIASAFGGLPTGARWHMDLLLDMTLDLAPLRPVVLRQATADALSDLLGFRHVVRNLYAWDLRRDEIERLLAAMPDTQRLLAEDLESFGSFLQSLAMT